MASRVASAVLALLVAVITSASAALPAKRPEHPWEVEPPTAETVRQLHKMLPHNNLGDEPMPEAEMAASFEAFLRARGGRLEPMWANHSHAERTANLQRHHASRRSERRRAQAMLGTNLFADASAEEKESNLAAVLDQPESTCDDPLATNTGQPTPCAYAAPICSESTSPRRRARPRAASSSTRAQRRGRRWAGRARSC